MESFRYVPLDEQASVESIAGMSRDISQIPLEGITPDALPTLDAGLVGGADTGPTGLPEFDEAAYVLKDNSGIKLNFISRLFGGSAAHARLAVVQFACRYRIVKHEGMAWREGVIIRLSAAITSFDAEVDLKLSSIAAAGELKLSRACVSVSWAGYTGPIGDNLLEPEDFGVSNYAQFLATYRNLKRLVLDAPHSGYYEPVRFALA